jgi:hypothetical protein
MESFSGPFESLLFGRRLVVRQWREVAPPFVSQSAIISFQLPYMKETLALPLTTLYVGTVVVIHTLPQLLVAE